MAELGNGGTLVRAVTGSASTQPSASLRATARGGSGRHRSSTSRCASSRGTRSDKLLALHQVDEKGAELGPEVLALESEFDGGGQVVDLLADVVSALLEYVVV